MRDLLEAEGILANITESKRQQLDHIDSEHDKINVNSILHDFDR